MKRVWDKINDEWIYEEGEEVVQVAQEASVRQETPEPAAEPAKSGEGENLVLLLSELGACVK